MEDLRSADDDAMCQMDDSASSHLVERPLGRHTLEVEQADRVVGDQRPVRGAHVPCAAEFVAAPSSARRSIAVIAGQMKGRSPLYSAASVAASCGRQLSAVRVASGALISARSDSRT
jgi:hypothetical protein